MISFNAWLDGGSAIGIVLSAIFISLFFLYRSKKLNLRLLAIAALMVLFLGLIYIAPTADLMLLIFTDKNLDPSILYGLLAYGWAGPLMICGIYIGAELLRPDRKKYILLIYLLLGIVFEYFLFFDTFNNISAPSPPPGSGDLIDGQIILFSPSFILTAIFLLSVIILNGLGFLHKARQLEGTIRKKFIALSLTFIMFTLLASIDAFIPVGPGLVLVRIGMILVTITLYYGLKPT